MLRVWDNVYGDVIMTQAIVKVHLMNLEQRQVAADPQTKPTDLGCESANRLLLSLHTHFRHLILLSPKVDIHFTVPQRAEGRVDL